jgi:hypothetical protein
MSYEAEVKVTVTIKDGPAPVQGKYIVAGITDANTKRISFKASDLISNDGKNVQDMYPGDVDKRRRVLCRTLTIAHGETIEFIAIKATRYVYKKCVNKEVSGIAFSLKDNYCPANENESYTSCERATWLTTDQIFLNVCNALNGRSQLAIIVDEELFDCTKKDPDEIIVTLTYALKGQVDESDGTSPCCAETPSGKDRQDPFTAPTGMNQRSGRQFANS